MLKQYLGLNRSTQNKLVRSEFGRFPLLLDAHTRTWSYIKYLKNKSDDSLAKISYELESSPENNDSLFVNCDKIYHEISKKNAKKESDPYKSGKSKFKLFIQNYYIDWWKIQIRGASTSASFAMHKNSYSLEPYLSVITIKNTEMLLQNLGSPTTNSKFTLAARQDLSPHGSFVIVHSVPILLKTKLIFSANVLQAVTSNFPFIVTYISNIHRYLPLLTSR